MKFPKISKPSPCTVASKLVKVQPLSFKPSPLFHMDMKYGTENIILTNNTQAVIHQLMKLIKNDKGFHNQAEGIDFLVDVLRNRKYTAGERNRLNYFRIRYIDELEKLWQ